jgi:RNA polymerase sigma-B factor
MTPERDDLNEARMGADARAEDLFRRLPNEDARRELVELFRPLAVHLARRYARRGQDAEDLTQVALMGLLNAIDRFDPDFGSRFVSFAVPTITGEIKRYFRDSGWGTGVPRRLKDASVITRQVNEQLTQRLGRSPTIEEIAAETGLSPDDVAEAAALGSAYRPEALDAPTGKTDGTRIDELGTADDRFELLTDLHALEGILDGRPERDKKLLHMRFYEELTQRQIADRMGISQMHVSRLLAVCLDEMRLLMQD